MSSRLKIDPWCALRFLCDTPSYRNNLDLALNGFKETEIEKEAEDIVQLCRDYLDAFDAWPEAASQELVDYYTLNRDQYDHLDASVIKQFYDIELSQYNLDVIENHVKEWLAYYHQRSVWMQAGNSFREEDTSVASEKFVQSILQASDLPFSHNNRLEGNLFDPKAYVDTDMVMIPSGYASLDRMLSPTGKLEDGGFVRGGLYVWTAGAKAGKTLLLGNIAVQQIKMRKNVAIASFEMPFFDYSTRMNTNLHDIKANNYSPERIREHLQNNEFDYGHMSIRQFPGSCTPQDVTQWVLQLERKHNMKIDVVIVDYVQIVTTGRRNSTSDSYTRVKNICEDLRSAAMQHDWVCLTAAQAKRDAEPGVHLTPVDIAESHGIIQTADAVFSYIRKGDNDTRYLEVIESRRSNSDDEIKFSVNWSHYRLKEVSKKDPGAQAMEDFEIPIPDPTNMDIWSYQENFNNNKEK